MIPLFLCFLRQPLKRFCEQIQPPSFRILTVAIDEGSLDAHIVSFQCCLRSNIPPFNAV